MKLALLIIGAWLVIGIILFPFLWTKDEDLKLSDLPWAFYAAILGPLCLLAWVDGKRVLIRKRGEK